MEVKFLKAVFHKCLVGLFLSTWTHMIFPFVVNYFPRSFKGSCLRYFNFAFLQ